MGDSRYPSETPAWGRGDDVLFKSEAVKHLEGDYPSQDREIVSKEDILIIADAIREEQAQDDQG